MSARSETASEKTLRLAFASSSKLESSACLLFEIASSSRRTASPFEDRLELETGCLPLPRIVSGSWPTASSSRRSCWARGRRPSAFRKVSCVQGSDAAAPSRNRFKRETGTGFPFEDRFRTEMVAVLSFDHRSKPETSTVSPFDDRLKPETGTGFQFDGPKRSIPVFFPSLNCDF